MAQVSMKAWRRKPKEKPKEEGPPKKKKVKPKDASEVPACKEEIEDIFLGREYYANGS